MELQAFVCVAIDLLLIAMVMLLTAFFSGGNCGHSNVSVGPDHGCVTFTQSVLYCHTKENKVDSDGKDSTL